MRWVAGGLAVALVAVVFVLTTPDEVAPDPTEAPVPSPITTSTSLTPTPVGELEPGEPAVTRGALPDGTEYVVTVTPGLVNEWHGSSAGIVTDLERSPAAVGILRFKRGSIDDYSFADGTYRVPAGAYHVEIQFHDSILDDLGEDAEVTITSSIRGAEVEGLPTLELDSPFRWPGEGELPLMMETRYSTFSVRRGCSRFAAACSDDGSVQVVWRPAELSSAPQWRLPQVSVEAPGDD